MTAIGDPVLKSMLICALALLVSGCVIVGSDQPLFGSGDIGHAVLRNGVWALPDDNCQFEPSQPAVRWPQCANPTQVTDGRLTGGFGKADKPPQTIAIVLADGDPVVLQLEAPDDRKPDDPRYVYAALEPIRTDPQGRIVEAHVWLVLCFKTPLNPKAAKPHPYPGLVLRQGSQYCRATQQGPVRDAARLTRTNAIKGEPFWLTARWIRDGGPR